jgi:hypothetical protein
MAVLAHRSDAGGAPSIEGQRERGQRGAAMMAAWPLMLQCPRSRFTTMTSPLVVASVSGQQSYS